MKAVILAGGYGTRISEESQFKPKPMIEIGGMPILWHIMKLYTHYGVNEFIICAGYKQHVIKEWFADYFLHTSDITFDFTQDDKIIVHNKRAEKWKVTVVDTGLDTMTGGRLKRISNFIGDEPFFMTYGDGVSDVDINALLNFHKKHGKLATMSAVKPESRFGVLDLTENNEVRAFREKSDIDSGWINAGFMVLEPKVLDYIKMIRLCLSVSRWNSLQEKVSLCAASITDFGSVWTHCVTRSVWKSFGTTVLLLGKCGRNDA